MKKHSLQSAILAVALMFGISTTMTVAHALVAPAAAQAGVLGKIKGAAKTVGKGAATVGKTVGKGATTVGKGALHAGTTAGKGIGREVKRVAVASGKAAVQSPVGQSVRRATNVVRRAAGRI